MSSNFVVSLAQDKFGYMWFGTNNGLNRYDGHSITTFWHDPADSSSLAWNWVESLLVDHEGNLWVGTHGGGLDLFDYDTESFIHYRHDSEDLLSLSNDVITKLYEDSKQRLWVGTAYGGLNRFDRQTGSFKHYRRQKDKPQSLSDDNVRRIYEDRNGTLWVGTGGPQASRLGGLNRFDETTETFTRYFSDPQNEQTLMDDRVWGLYEDKTGVFWVGSWGDGLHQMDREQETFVRLRNGPGNPAQLSSPYLRRSDPTDPGFGAGITRIYQDRSDVLWIAAVYGGVDRFDLKTGERAHYEADRNIPNSVGLNWPWSIYEDRQNIIWLASAGNGVYKVLPGEFKHYQHSSIELNVQVVFEDQKKTIWVGTDKGLFQVDQKERALTPVSRQSKIPDRLARTSIQAVAGDRKGNLWFGTTDGLYRLETLTGRIKRYQSQLNVSHSLSHDWIVALAGSSKEGEALWIVSKDNTLHRYEADTDRFIRYSFLDSMTADWQSRHAIVALSRDTKGKLWMGMDAGGAFRWDPAAETLEYFPDVFSWAFTYHEDRKGRFWIGSRLSGIMQFDPEKGVVVQKITEKEGLASGRINGILEDQSGFLWLSAQDGYLSRFDPETGAIKNFDSKDGLKKNSFLPGSFYKRQNGDFLFGGSNGLTAFDPEAFAANPFPPEIAINHLKINGKTEIVAEKGSIELSHGENNLTFVFAALHYIRPDENQVLTKLENYDREWQDAEGRREIRYTNLDPGVYTFKVKAASSDDVWTEKEAALRILIHPPWWETWQAYLFYFLAVGLALYTAYRYQKRRWLLQASLQIEKTESKRLKELDEFKSRFYTNITHEFRTPLTVIQGLADQIGENPRWKTQEFAGLIKKNSQKLLQLINQMLDLSKLEAGKLESEYIQGDVVKYLGYLTESFHSLAFSRKIAIAFFSPVDKLLMDYDPEKLRQIIDNLVSNALKFTPEYGKVTISARAIGEKNGQKCLEINVRDTGKGIPKEKLPFIFDRFYQADNSSVRQGEGTGLGLALVKELLDLMGGSIRAESEMGKGTNFSLRLPIRNEAKLEAIESRSPLTLRSRESIISKLENSLPIGKKGEAPVVLLVEDNTDVVYYLRNCLEDQYQLLEANNGQTGIDKAFENIPDLVISDVMMPEMDGFELCRALKTDERTSHIPIILLTAKVTQSDKMEGLAHGADVYLSKPFQKEELLLRLENLLELRRKIQEKYRDGQSNTNQQTDPFLQKVFDIIETRLDDPDFSVLRLSRALGMSRVQVHRKLKALTGLSTTQYIRNIRMQKAYDLLKTSELTLRPVFQEHKMDNQLFTV